MRAKLLVTAASVLGAACAVLACQAITGLTDIEKVDCLDCGDSGGETGPPCTHTFCASFDQGSVLTGWQAQGTSPGGMLALDTQMPKSPPASLLASVPKTERGSAAATLGQSFAKPLKGAHLELDMRLQQIGSFPVPEAGVDAGPDADAGDAATEAVEGGVADASTEAGVVDAGAPVGAVLSDFARVATISAGDVATPTGVALAWRNGGAFVLVFTPIDGANPRGGVSEVAFPLVPTPALDKWIRVKLDVVFSATGGGSVKVSIDGAPALDKSGLSIAGAGAPGSQIEIGLATRDTTPELKASYDNVTLDLDP